MPSETQTIDAPRERVYAFLMIGKLKEIEDQARRLSASDREALARRLFESVHHKELTNVDESWIAVAEERYGAYRSGQDKGIEEEDFFGRVRGDLKW